MATATLASTGARNGDGTKTRASAFFIDIAVFKPIEERRMKGWSSTGLLLAGACSPAMAFAFNVYKVGGDAACPYATIQQAVDAAKASPGADYVWLAMNGTYSGENVHIDNDTDGVIIVGGLVDCNDNDVDTRTTTVSGAGNDGSAVFTIRGNSSVLLQNLLITGANRNSDANGGGVDFDGSGFLGFKLSYVSLNSSGYGGGVNAKGDGGHLDVVLEDNTVILNNTASTSGGGIRVEGDTRLYALQQQTWIGLNHADGGFGGGIEVIGPAHADIGSAGYNGVGVVSSNTAQYGGGISINEDTIEEGTALRVFTVDPAHPVQVSNNFASATGGGIYLGSSFGQDRHIFLCLADFRLDDNVAQEGSAIYAERNATVAINAATLDEDQCVLPEPAAALGAVSCAAGTECNELKRNIAADGNNNPTEGSTILLQTNAFLRANRFRASSNTGAHVLREVADDSDSGAFVYNCLLTDNMLTQEVLAMTDGDDDIGELSIASCTIAHNTIGSEYVIAARHYFGLADSIVDQLGHPTVTFSGGFFNVDYVLSNDVSTLPMKVGIALGQPHFVDAASGDYHLMPTSEGVDFAPAHGGVDLDGEARAVNLPIPDQFGPMDLGAYEIQLGTVLACAGTDTIFCNGFESP